VNNFDVFISHNSRDNAAVRQLATLLKEKGIKVWLDEWEILPGRRWQEALEEAISSIPSAAVLVGREGLGPWEVPEMRALLQEFVARGLPVIPVLLPGAPSRVELPLFLRAFTWVDLRSGLSEQGVNTLVWGITGKRFEDSISPGTATPSYEEPVTLEEVFRTSGLPTYTYIEPSIYRNVASDLRQAGKHVIITGPSGSGKTSLLFRILSEMRLKEGPDFLYIPSLGEDALNQVQNALKHSLDGTLRGLVILDDFHVLDRPLRAQLGAKLKLLADRVFLDPKAARFVLIGIATSAEGLLFNATDLAQRLGIYAMPRPKPSDLRGLIEKGEQRLLVEFVNKDQIITESSSSFFICQYLCQNICLNAQVLRTADARIQLDGPIDDIRDSLVLQLSARFGPFMMLFLAAGGNSPEEKAPFLAILAAMSGIPRALIWLEEIIEVAGDLGPAIRLVRAQISHAIETSGRDGALGKYLYYEDGAELLSIQDPTFRYYLTNTKFNIFLETLGITGNSARIFTTIVDRAKGKYIREQPTATAKERRQEIFICYSRQDEAWLDRLQVHLRPLTREKTITLWVDTQIRAGSSWRTEIAKAIARARVAILLVSSNFLASDFIVDHELPAILQAAKGDGLTIVWIPIGASLYAETEIADYQAAHDPSTPLNTLSRGGQDKVFVKISRMIQETLASSA
jgi:hypothetical protein